MGNWELEIGKFGTIYFHNLVLNLFSSGITLATCHLLPTTYYLPPTTFFSPVPQSLLRTISVYQDLILCRVCKVTAKNKLQQFALLWGTLFIPLNPPWKGGL